MSQRNRPWAGMDSPASERVPVATTCWNCSSVMRWRPTSKSVPTTARTMLRRKRLAEISKYHVVGEVLTHWAVETCRAWS